jgi:sodium/hydrogen antiporter
VSAGIVALIAASIFCWGTLSARLERSDLTAPILFVAVGVLIANVASLNTEIEAETVKLITEVTLAWVLFSDAAAVRLDELRAGVGVFARLLGLALPVTVVLGWLLAWAEFRDFDVWLALVVGAALAPTDAALSASVMKNPGVPARVRGILNVESGLNDGIVTPIVLVALAGAAAVEGHGSGTGHAAVQLLLGAAIGIGAGFIGGRTTAAARRRKWVDEPFAGPAVLGLALASYAASVAAGGNGFIAAFVGGIAFGTTAGPAGPHQVFFVEQTADLASLLVWTLFGIVAVPVIVDAAAWQLALYTLLSLTAVRMLPVLLCLQGTDLSRRSRTFIAWFGPRGLASVVFALLTLEELGSRADPAVAVLATTVLVSVVAHGISAGPLAAWYGAAAGHTRELLRPSGFSSKTERHSPIDP